MLFKEPISEESLSLCKLIDSIVKVLSISLITKLPDTLVVPFIKFVPTVGTVKLFV